MLASVQSPHIVQFFGWSKEPGGDTLMVMELLETSLYDFIHEDEKTPLDLQTICAMTHQMGLGLSVLHGKQIVHGDMKSLNVLLSLKPIQVKLGDFGLATTMQTSMEKKGCRCRFPFKDGSH